MEMVEESICLNSHHNKICYLKEISSLITSKDSTCLVPLELASKHSKDSFQRMESLLNKKNHKKLFLSLWRKRIMHQRKHIKSQKTLKIQWYQTIKRVEMEIAGM